MWRHGEGGLRVQSEKSALSWIIIHVQCMRSARGMEPMRKAAGGPTENQPVVEATQERGCHAGATGTVDIWRRVTCYRKLGVDLGKESRRLHRSCAAVQGAHNAIGLSQRAVGRLTGCIGEPGCRIGGCLGWLAKYRLARLGDFRTFSASFFLLRSLDPNVRTDWRDVRGSAI